MGPHLNVKGFAFFYHVIITEYNLKTHKAESFNK